MSVAPEFSVVVPAYNATATIEQTLRSILGQSRRELELIVVDDGSTDGTPELVERVIAGDPRARMIVQENKGTAGARNTGLAAATGRLISFLDNDDMWLDRYLELMATALESDPVAGFAYTDAWLLDDRTLRIHSRPVMKWYGDVPERMSPDELLRRLITGPNFVMSSVTMPRAALEGVGGFNEAIKGADDLDLWLRMGGAGFGAVKAQGCSLVQRDRSDSLSKDLAMMMSNVAEVFRRVSEEYEMPEAARVEARGQIAAIDREVAMHRGQRKLAARAYGLRVKAVALRRRVSQSRDWLETPPEEVARSLPWLVRPGPR